MKKIFTFLFCIPIISAAFAQEYSHGGKNLNITTDYRSNSTFHRDFDYQNTINQRDQEIQKVNYQNEWQIHQVVNNYDLGIWEKRDILNNLETQRIQKLNDIYNRYNDAIANYRGSAKNNRFQHSLHDEDNRR